MERSAQLPTPVDPESLAAIIDAGEAMPAFLSPAAAAGLVHAGALIAYRLYVGGHGYRAWLRTPDSRHYWSAADYLGTGTQGYWRE